MKICCVLLALLLILPLATSAETEEYTYDALQSLFIEIDSTLTMKELESIISSKGLEYTIEEVKRTKGEIKYTYKIAFDRVVSLQGRRSGSGDYLMIVFSKNHNNTIQSKVYHNKAVMRKNDKEVYEALFYYFEPQEKAYVHENTYYGYRQVKARNGVFSKEEQYVEYNDAEEVINAIVQNL